jgi:hypothetical protein
MAIPIPRTFVEHVLLGPLDDRRQLQDSPILGDVWLAFARKPNACIDLLITPYKDKAAPTVAIALHDQLSGRRKEDPKIACLQGIVAAQLYFADVLRAVVPMSGWWQSARIQQELRAYLDEEAGPEKLNRAIDYILGVGRQWNEWNGRFPPAVGDHCSALDRYVALTGLLLWAARQRPPRRASTAAHAEQVFAQILEKASCQVIADLLIALFDQIYVPEPACKLVYQVSKNRTAATAIARSVPAVKGDAARLLFKVDCSKIGWAIVDSGIDQTHPAFTDGNSIRRVRKAYDFTQLRQIVSLSNDRRNIRKANLDQLRARRELPDDADDILGKLAADALKQRPTDWSLVERLVTLKGTEQPPSGHGTHVAGILGASRGAAPGDPQGTASDGGADHGDGMCPDINLYDFRVLAPGLEDTELAIIAALQFMRYLNDRNPYTLIHGANLSLSIPHNVRNFACGRTPICIECERLVDSGTVVVAAAGNLGYQSFETRNGLYESYAALSITDPGNADGVITVGSTHRFSPHTYGVSFFSSRGPTGDGRRKPDIVAPGERICGPLPGPQWGDLDGTSMAAPHVSGAAAMLMARYSELIGQPRRIKSILCDSATDLGRERSFQGNGMLDVLRAFQSV